MNPLMYSLRPSFNRTSVNTVRQRVMSAKLLKLRSIQNQLNDANYHLSELTKENQILKNLQKRQDKALSKYENTNAELPRLIHSHEEQLRILTEKNKSQRKMLKELNEVLKTREDELIKVQDKLTHLEKLNRDKRLLDREKLVEQIEDLRMKLSKSEEQVTVLNRKVMLESKSAKHKLNFEITRHRQCQKELSQALEEIDRLTGLLEKRENTVRPIKNRFSRVAQRQSCSMVTLNGICHSQNRSRSSDEKLTGSGSDILLSKIPVTDVKLEPITCKMDETLPKKSNDIFNLPSENIKNRLASSSTKSRSSEENLFNPNYFSSGSNHSLSSHESPLENMPLADDDENIQAASNSKLVEKLTEHLDNAIQKATDNANIAFNANLANYCSEIMGNVKNCGDRIEIHKDSLKISKDDTDTLIDTFRKTQLLESKLKSSLEFLKDEDCFVDCLPEELRRPKSSKDKKESIKQPEVKLEDRKKLLATLKAIDNGESIESVEEVPINFKSEIFSD